jgi:hypothetical protein
MLDKPVKEAYLIDTAVFNSHNPNSTLNREAPEIYRPKSRAN